MQAQRQHSVQLCALKRHNRAVAKTHRRAEIRQRTRSELERTKTKTRKRLQDRFILINVIGGTIANTLIWIAKYGADAFEDMDLTFFGLFQNFLLQLVGK